MYKILVLCSVVVGAPPLPSSVPTISPTNVPTLVPTPIPTIAPIPPPGFGCEGDCNGFGDQMTNGADGCGCLGDISNGCCSNNGVCQQLGPGNNFTCACDDFFRPTDVCGSMIDDCGPHVDCSGHGDCDHDPNNEGEFLCCNDNGGDPICPGCDDGFLGDICQFDGCEEDGLVCGDNGHCTGPFFQPSPAPDVTGAPSPAPTPPVIITAPKMPAATPSPSGAPSPSPTSVPMFFAFRCECNDGWKGPECDVPAPFTTQPPSPLPTASPTAVPTSAHPTPAATGIPATQAVPTPRPTAPPGPIPQVCIDETDLIGSGVQCGATWVNVTEEEYDPHNDPNACSCGQDALGGTMGFPPIPPCGGLADAASICPQIFGSGAPPLRVAGWTIPMFIILVYALT